MNTDKPAVIFLHVPKTAGSTLGHPMYRQFAGAPMFFADGRNPEASISELKAQTLEQLASIRCISGHMAFGIHELLPQKTKYVAMIREPVVRIVSLYFHILRDEGHYLYKVLHQSNMSLEEFVESELTDELSNAQIRQLLGPDGSEGMTFAEDNDVYLKKAVANIEEWFPVLGVTEYFDESLLLMKSVFGWNNVFYAKRKVGGYGGPEKVLNDSLVTRIKQINQLDMALYDYSVNRLKRQIANQGPRFGFELKAFRTMNSLYNKVRHHKNNFPFSYGWKAARKVFK